MAIIMSNDYGFGNNKYAYVYKGKQYKDSFESRCMEGEGLSGTCLIMQGKSCTFGEGKLASDYEHTTKDHEVHRLLLWKAMYDVYKKTGETDFGVVAGTDINRGVFSVGLGVAGSG